MIVSAIGFYDQNFELLAKRGIGVSTAWRWARAFKVLSITILNIFMRANK